MHLAETRDELRLLHSADGPLVDWLSALGFWDPAAVPRGIRAMDYLHAMAKAHRAVVVHGNYLDRQELDWLARHRDRMGVVYCPRTHSFFGHAPYPLGEMLAAGVRVSLGTDSRASNPDLSLLAEMRHAARQHPRLAPDAIFRLGTLSGAESLGRQARVGSLAPGKQADFLVIGIGGAADRELLESVLDCGSSVQRVYKSGELVFKAGSC
jgi:cytosine/adenosine deaminase-related metal-dependent hydrolase